MEWNCGNSSFTASTTSTVFVPGCQNDRVRIVPPVRHAIVLHAVVNLAQILEADGRAVAVSNDQRTIQRGARELPIGLQSEGSLLAVERADGEIHVSAGHRCVHVVYADLPRGHGLGIELDAHGVFLRAVDLHLRHALYHRDALAHQGFRVLIHGVKRERLRAHGQVKDGLVRGIYFGVSRRRGHAGGKLGGSARNGGLHVLRGAIDVAAEIELQRDVGGAERAG